MRWLSQLFAVPSTVVIEPEPEHQHVWGQWELGRERITSAIGTTETDVQVRRCSQCGFYQRAPLDKSMQVRPITCTGSKEAVH